MILVIDNYDSFTYNLVHYLGQCGQETIVKRNDEISIDEIKDLNISSSGGNIEATDIICGIFIYFTLNIYVY